MMPRTGMFVFTLLTMCLLPLRGIAGQVDTVAISFESAGYTLHGRLLLPAGSPKVPAIVFLVGSGGNSSYQTNYKRFLKENFEDQLLSRQIALLYFDKRGVNASEGKWHRADFYDRTEDARAAVRFLKTLSRIDSSRVGVAGHSQGGWIAELMASRYPGEIDFAVSLAGSATSVREQLAEDFQSSLICKGIPLAEAQRKAIRKTKLVCGAVSVLAVFKKQWRQLNRIKNFDPRADLKQMRVPVLFVFAENDELVYPQSSIERLKAVFEGNLPGHITTCVVAGATHSFYMNEKCDRRSGKLLHYSPDFQKVLKEWVLKHCEKEK